MGTVIDDCVRHEPILAASRDEISALQLRKLQWAIRYAYENVPLYKNKYDAAEVHPDDLKHLEDLAKFPFTTKEDLRQSYPFNMFAVPMKEIVRLHASSGTTGKPTVVGYTKADISVWSHLGARSIRVSGGLPDHKVHIAYGYGLFTGGLGAHYGAEALGCAVIPMSGGQTEKQVQMILDFEPEIIMVTPSYMLALADAFAERGIDARDTSLKIGIFGAEPWSEEMRREIEQKFAIDAVDIYGLSELMGPGVANECVETKDGAHIWEDAFLPEIVDPDTFAPLEDGHSGEFVLTALFKEAMPIIRYRTKDLTKLLPGTAFSHRRFERITART
ncbi:MAG: AMP-binding protein, partial [Kordiimonadaceae bacterium]|nr:AMP-binding protein [Kordiimonadaceae bacterium]